MLEQIVNSIMVNQAVHKDMFTEKRPIRSRAKIWPRPSWPPIQDLCYPYSLTFYPIQDQCYSDLSDPLYYSWSILRLPYDPDLMSIGHQSLDFIPLTQTSLAFSPPVLYAATTCLDTTNLLISLPWQEEPTREEEVTGFVTFFLSRLQFADFR